MQIIPSFLVDKASCTRQFESELSLHSLASLFPIKERYFFESLRLPFQRELHFLPKPLSIVFTTPSVPLVGDRNLRRKDVTALRCSEPLRYKVGGPIKGLRQVLRDGTAWVLGISPIQHPYYITSSYTYQFFEKISFVSFVGLRIAKHTPSPHLFYNIVTWMQF